MDTQPEDTLGPQRGLRKSGIRRSARPKSRKDKDSALALAPQRKSETEILIQNSEIIEEALKKFQGHFESLKDTQGFQNEFQEIGQIEDESFDVENIKAGAKNWGKNRYEDILPYDHSRVVLGGHDNYINASFVTDIAPGAPIFIAAQGPIPSTVKDFWQMLWENDCRLVVMLTNLVEASMVKCEKYWPDDGCPIVYEGWGDDAATFTVSLIYEENGIHWTHRTIGIEAVNPDGSVESTQISQFHFNDWPDYGAPASVKPFVQFLHAVMRRNLEIIDEAETNELPICCHCSAGVGRTGTFIAAYTMVASLRYLTPETELNLQQLIINMRTNRMFLVQSLAQYTFLYEAALTAAQQHLKSAPKLKVRAPFFCECGFPPRSDVDLTCSTVCCRPRSNASLWLASSAARFDHQRLKRRSLMMSGSHSPSC
eukprot:m.196467 g.196467  ORF g.196467 m.196467 type:complete len:427 (-) comp10631_c0_seq5:3285-4565(-)